MSHLHHFKEQKNRLHPYTDYRPAPAGGTHPPATDILSHLVLRGLFGQCHHKRHACGPERRQRRADKRNADRPGNFRARLCSSLMEENSFSFTVGRMPWLALTIRLNSSTAEAANGRSSFLRLFFAPGMGHCAAGPGGADNFGQNNAGGGPKVSTNFKCVGVPRASFEPLSPEYLH